MPDDPKVDIDVQYRGSVERKVSVIDRHRGSGGDTADGLMNAGPWGRSSAARGDQNRIDATSPAFRDGTGGSIRKCDTAMQIHGMRGN